MKKIAQKHPARRSAPSQEKTGISRHPDLVSIAIILFLGSVIYSNSFACSFHLDDLNNIVNNNHLRNLWDIKTWWNDSPNRPVSIFTFVLNYHFNRFDEWYYHLVNLGIHLINACLAYWLTLQFFSSPALKSNAISKDKKMLAFFTAILFVSHPLATQSVTYIVQRMASLAAMFYLLSLVLYIQARLTEKNNLGKLLLFFGAFVSAIAAMLSKENAYTLPGAILLSEIFFFSDNKLSLNFRNYKLYAYVAVFAGIIIFTGIKFSFRVFEPIPPSYRNEETITSFNYFLTQFGVIVKYIQLLFIPLNQNFDYDYPLVKSVFEIGTLVCLLFLLSLIVLGVLLFRKHRIISFGIFWFFLTLSVESSIIPIRDLIFEHRTYLPSFGFFLVLSSGIYLLLWEKYKYIALSILGMIIGVNSILTFERNKIWKDELTLWSDVISKSPNKATPYVNRGSEYMSHGQSDKALADYSRAIEINPKHARAWCNRGIVYDEMGQRQKAIADYTKAIGLDPKYKDAYSNRGAVFYYLGQMDKAIADYTSVIAIDSNYLNAYTNRANAYNNLEMWDKAIVDCSKAIGLDSNFTEAYFNRGIAYKNLGQQDKAIADYSKVITIAPNYIKAYSNRGVVFASLEQWENAINDYSAAIRINPKFAKAYFNRGLAYSNLQQLDKAIADYNQAIEIDPNYTKAYSSREAAYTRVNPKGKQ